MTARTGADAGGAVGAAPPPPPSPPPPPPPPPSPSLPAAPSPSPALAGPDFPALYDRHPAYVARRRVGSFEQAQIDLEVRLFKLPHLVGLLPPGALPGSVLEIGCATGELIAAMPVRPGGRRVGLDISAENIAAARARFAQVEFRDEDFRRADLRGAAGAGDGAAFDVVVLSDVLEHVPDDAAFLRDAAALGRCVLLNLPLEDNWLNRRRRYGPGDVSGHLRRYSLAEGLALVARTGLEVVAHERHWLHEGPSEAARRGLRRERTGAAFAGAGPGRAARRAVFALATAERPLGRRLFTSNLFLRARARPPR